VPAVAKAANLDPNINGTWGYCKKPLQALYHAQIRPTPELIEREFVRRDGYWWTQFWKGRDKGEYIEPHELTKHWQRAMTWRESPVANGKHPARAAPTLDANGQAVPAMWETIRQAREKRGAT
jgi:hypothetical protein